MKCVICQFGETEPGTTTVTLTRGETTVVIRDVPAQVCTTCGEEYVDQAPDLSNQQCGALTSLLTFLWPVFLGRAGGYSTDEKRPTASHTSSRHDSEMALYASGLLLGQQEVT